MYARGSRKEEGRVLRRVSFFPRGRLVPPADLLSRPLRANTATHSAFSSTFSSTCHPSLVVAKR